LVSVLKRSCETVRIKTRYCRLYEYFRTSVLCITLVFLCLWNCMNCDFLIMGCTNYEFYCCCLNNWRFLLSCSQQYLECYFSFFYAHNWKSWFFQPSPMILHTSAGKTSQILRQLSSWSFFFIHSLLPYISGPHVWIFLYISTQNTFGQLLYSVKFIFGQI
jgi:hypothetical protein